MWQPAILALASAGALALAAATPAAGAAPAAGTERVAVDPAWSSVLVGTDADGGGWARSVHLDPGTGDTYATGRLDNESTSVDMVTVAYRPDGTERWRASYDSGIGGGDTIRGSALSPAGDRIFVMGQEPIDNGRIATIAYDTVTGEEVWDAHFGSFAAPTTIDVSPSGETIFVVAQMDANGDSAFTTIAYDAARGDQLWVAQTGGGDMPSSPKAVAVSPDGATLYVTGQSHLPGELNDYLTVAYDTADGSERWATRYSFGTGLSIPSDVTVSPDGQHVFVTGSSDGLDLEGDAATVAYDATSGTELWAARYNGPWNSADSGSTLAVSPDGRTVYLGGHAYEEFFTSHVLTAAYDTADGTRQWSHLYPGRGPESPADWSQAREIVVSQDGTRVWLAAAHLGLTTMTFTSAGNLIDVTQFGDGAYFADSAQPMSLAVGVDDTWLVIGGRVPDEADVGQWTVAAYALPRRNTASMT